MHSRPEDRRRKSLSVGPQHLGVPGAGEALLYGARDAAALLSLEEHRGLSRNHRLFQGSARETDHWFAVRVRLHRCDAEFLLRAEHERGAAVQQLSSNTLRYFPHKLRVRSGDLFETLTIRAVADDNELHLQLLRRLDGEIDAFVLDQPTDAQE